MSLRWDKYIWSVRLAKTRSQASEALSKGKIKINDKETKPSREPKIGDLIQVHKNGAVFSYRVIQLLEKRVGPNLKRHLSKEKMLLKGSPQLWLQLYF